MKIIYINKTAVIILLLSFIRLSAFSQTWNGSTNTNWNTATNWTPNTVPTSASDVIINTAAGNQPKLQNAVSINSLNLNSGATLNLAGFTLTNATTATLSGSNIITGTTGNIICSSGSIISCIITGDFTLKADSNSNFPVQGCVFKGANN
ncbi:MAG: hypothetical protein M3Z92_00720, partial [Bacteroidota bacterium]|nr:hypothetical protein [Bacteroidota bacterium]